jgi:hypothetical protein
MATPKAEDGWCRRWKLREQAGARSWRFGAELVKIQDSYPEWEKEQSEWERAGTFHAKERNTDQRESDEEKGEKRSVIFRGL